MNECALQEPERVRARVRGDGPDRRLLPPFHQIGVLDPLRLADLKAETSYLLSGYPEGYNDIYNEDIYQIAQECKLKMYFPPEYRQILFQVTGNDTPARDEWDYKTFTHKALRFSRFIDPFVSKTFRSRLALLPPGHVLDWHIDTNTSYACRVMMIVNGMHRFMVRKKGKTYQTIMRPGEVWFCNTGYSHRVEVVGEDTRVAILLGCHYEAIKDKVPCSN